MNRLPLNLIGGAYADDATPWADQDLQNMLVVGAERSGTRTPAILRQVPGMYVYLTLGAGPIRGVHDVEGTLYVVSGSQLYKVNADRTFTGLGTINGVSRVAMAHNQITDGNQVVISTGSTGYVYNSATNELTTITDDSWFGATSLDFVDGYITAVEPGGRFWYHSDLADATSYNSLDEYEGETAPDKIVTHIVLHRQVILFSQRTIEVFDDTGEATNTFQRLNGVSIDIGCTSRYSPARVGGTVCFLDDKGIVRMMRGYEPIRISTHAVEQAIARCVPENAFGFAFEDRGHQIYYLTFPDGHTWGFDLTNGEIHRRQSFGLDRWRINAMTRWNGLWIGGDYDSGVLYALNWDYATDSTDPLIRRRRGATIAANQNRVFCPEVEILAEVGTDDATAVDLANPALALSGDLPNGPLNEEVSYQYLIQNGVAPYTCTISAGALPTGLSISASGLVTGTRTAIGSFSWTVQCVDANGTTVTLNDTSDTYALPVLLDGAGGAYTGSVYSLTYLGTGYPAPSTHYQTSSSSDGRLIAYQAVSNNIAIGRYDSSTNKYTNLTITGTTPGTGGSAVSGTAINSDKSRVFVSSSANQKFYVYYDDGTGYTNLWVSAGLGTNPSALSLSPDGTEIACYLGSSVLAIYSIDATTGALTLSRSVSLAGTGSNRISWVGNYIAVFCSTAGNAKIINATTATVVATISGDAGFRALDGAWDGATAVMCGYSGATNKIVTATFDGASTFAIVNSYTTTPQYNAMTASRDRVSLYFYSSTTTRAIYSRETTTLTAQATIATGDYGGIWTGFGTYL